MAHYFQINHDLKLIAVFSPKCACQSIGYWFLNGLKHVENPDFKMISKSRVEPSKVPDYDDYLKVLFFRDPLRRLVSFYARWVVANDTQWCFADHKRRFSLQGRSFRRLIYALEHLRKNDLAFQHHLIPQLTNTHHIQFDKIVLVERLSEGLEELNTVLAIKADYRRRNEQLYSRQLQQPCADRNPEWLKINGIPSAQWFFDEETREIVGNVYREDLEFYSAISTSRKNPGFPKSGRSC